MKTSTLLLLAGIGAGAYFLRNRAKAAATSAVAKAVTAQPVNPTAGDVTVVPMLTDQTDEVVHYERTPAGWGSQAWASYGGGWGGHRRGGRRGGHH